MITWFSTSGGYIQYMKIDKRNVITSNNLNKGASASYAEIIIMPDISTLTNQFTFYVVGVGSTNSSICFNPIRPYSGDDLYILKSDNNILLENVQLRQTM